jgi:hypothetical protein
LNNPNFAFRRVLGTDVPRIFKARGSLRAAYAISVSGSIQPPGSRADDGFGWHRPATDQVTQVSPSTRKAPISSVTMTI